MINENSLLVYNIQKYSVHDGPGIRTTVFLKGCPLTCPWCHNPESQKFNKSITVNKAKCIECGLCTSVCPSLNNCIICGRCIEVCPTNARTWVGQEYTQEKIISIIEEDRVFYEESSGGVTFSGGEPLMQSKALFPVLKELKNRGYHIVIDTSGYSNLKNIKMLEGHVDLWLYDLKHMDSDKHQELIGVNNEIILNNLKYLDQNGANIWIRYPYIPGYNTELENIQKLGEFVAGLNTKSVYILPYHNLAEDKHHRFEIEYKLKGLREPGLDELEKAKMILEKYNLDVQIGG